MIDATDVARFLGTYAKEYNAGAYATPSAADILRAPGAVREWRSGEHRTVAVTRRLRQPARRAHFTGDRYLLPAGALVVTHLARSVDAPVPDLDRWDFVYGHPEDHDLAEALRGQGRCVHAVNVTPAGEIIACWSRYRPANYSPADRATLAEVRRSPLVNVSKFAKRDILHEARSALPWHDDYPYYSDGSWSAVSLRGFWPDDPTKGVKPAEMPRSWHAENPGAASLTCEWTKLAADCPHLVDLARQAVPAERLERVRLLRMRRGTLARHTDISDRATGTRDGAIARFHIPLVTDHAIELHTWDLDGSHTRQALEPWRCWYLDTRKPHAVVNPTPVERIHLVVDAVVDARVRAAIAPQPAV